MTAQLSGATSEDLTLTVSAAAVSPADPSDFALSANRELTIAAGETDSAGDGDGNGGGQRRGPSEPAGDGHRDGHGAGGAAGADADDHRRRRGADGDAGAGAGAGLGERGREPGDRAVERGHDRGPDVDRLGVGGIAGGPERLRAEREPGADDHGGRDGQHGDGDGDGGGQRRGPSGPAGDGHRDSHGTGGAGGAGSADADDRRRRRREEQAARIFPGELRVRSGGRARRADDGGIPGQRAGDGSGGRGADLRVGGRRGRPFRGRVLERGCLLHGSRGGRRGRPRRLRANGSGARSGRAGSGSERNRADHTGQRDAKRGR